MKQLLIIGSLLISLNSLGQFSFGPALYLGKSELSNDIVSVRSSTNYTVSRNSYALGLFGEYKLKKWFSMQLDILYDQLNSEQFYFADKEDPNSYRLNQFDKVEYLTLPLTMQFNYKKLKLNIGYQTSFLLANYSDINLIDPTGLIDIWTGKADEMFTKRNISFIAGISFDLYKNIHIEGRYTKGLSNIMNGTAGYQYNATTSQFLIGLYYKIQFKK
jgi:hypothetical protein